MKFDSLIFDIDGTLWDSSGALAEAYSAASAEFPFGQKHFTKEQVMGELGLPLKTIFRHLYPEVESIEQDDPAAADAMLDRLNEVSTEYEYRLLREKGAEVFPGVAQTLKELSEILPLFIVSNCEQGYIEIMTEASGIAQYITDGLCYGDTLKDKDITMKMLIERHGLKAPAYIGDIEKDAVSSAKAGVPFIWAEYGFGHVNPDQYYDKINDIRELKNLIK